MFGFWILFMLWFIDGDIEVGNYVVGLFNVVIDIVLNMVGSLFSGVKGIVD